MAETQNNQDQAPEPDAVVEEFKHQPPKSSKLDRLKDWYTSNKILSIPATVVLLLVVLAVVPFSRYAVAGIAYKKDFSVKVVDSLTDAPVSGASVAAGSASAETNATGVALLRHVSVGSKKLTITKKYYKDASATLVVPILRQKTVGQVQLTATGRQVKVTVTNTISKQPLADAEITAAGATSKTDKTGSAILVVPANSSQEKAVISLSGYNDAQATLKVSGNQIQDNPVSLTPAGKIYFLSKLSGKIDVVKTNLDGSGRQTVLAGTGKEDDQNTVLLASRDWKYLALLSKRSGSSNPALYLIDTSDDSLSTIDEGNASFSLAGWVDDSFVYSVDRNNVQQWQANGQAIKSFNAANKKLTTLAQNTASGTSTYDYLAELLGNVYAYDGQVYYTSSWQSYYQGSQINAKQATFNVIKPDGSGKKVIKSFSHSDLTGYGYGYVTLQLSTTIEKPDKIHLAYYDSADQKYFVYADGQVKEDTSPGAADSFSQAYPTFLQSPSGGNTFWTEPRDGKNTLFIGDEQGENGKQIATLSDYNNYGWYSDDYLLVSKNSSELYAMSKDGANVIKISDYHKPAQNFYGYGGGYGGL